MKNVLNGISKKWCNWLEYVFRSLELEGHYIWYTTAVEANDGKSTFIFPIGRQRLEWLAG